MVRSRLTRVRSKRDSKVAVLYLALAGAIIFAMITWGVPWMASTAGLLITEDTDVGGVEELSPTPPVFSDIPESTKEERVGVGGFAQPGVEVALFVNGAEYKRILTDDAGVFEFGSVPLIAGENRIYAFAISPRGSESEQSREYIIVQDFEPPELTLSSPADGEVFTTQVNRIAVFQGLVNEEGVRVTVGERLAIVQNDGSFSVPYQLSDGDQEVVVKAVDRAGNETEKKVKLRWEP